MIIKGLDKILNQKAAIVRAASFPETMTEFSKQEVAIAYGKIVNPKANAIRAWRSKYFIATLFEHEGSPLRVTINRTSLQADGHFVGDITWNELMEVKRQIGYGEHECVEIYPKDSMLVDVANMRHLWLFETYFSWREQ